MASSRDRAENLRVGALTLAHAGGDPEVTGLLGKLGYAKSQVYKF